MHFTFQVNEISAVDPISNVPILSKTNSKFNFQNNLPKIIERFEDLESRINYISNLVDLAGPSNNDLERLTCNRVSDV